MYIYHKYFMSGEYIFITIYLSYSPDISTLPWYPGPGRLEKLTFDFEGWPKVEAMAQCLTDSSGDARDWEFMRISTANWDYSDLMVILMGFNGTYHLVMTNIAMGNGP